VEKQTFQLIGAQVLGECLRGDEAGYVSRCHIYKYPVLHAEELGALSLGIREPSENFQLGDDIDFCILERSPWQSMNNKLRNSCYVLFLDLGSWDMYFCGFQLLSDIF